MSVKDTKLEEKEQLVVKGEILADSFAFRTTGEKLQNSEDELPSLSGNAGRYLRVNAQATGTEWDDNKVVANGEVSASDPELQSLRVNDIDFKVFHPETGDPTYLYGKIVSSIEVVFSVSGSTYYFVSSQITSENTAYIGVDSAFDDIRRSFEPLEITIPIIDNHESFTAALQIVYDTNPSIFFALVQALAFNDNIFVFKNQLRIYDGVDNYVYDLIRTGSNLDCYYLKDNNGTPTIETLSNLITTLSSGTVTNIGGWIND